MGSLLWYKSFIANLLQRFSEVSDLCVQIYLFASGQGARGIIHTPSFVFGPTGKKKQKHNYCKLQPLQQTPIQELGDVMQYLWETTGDSSGGGTGRPPTVR